MTATQPSSALSSLSDLGDTLIQMRDVSKIFQGKGFETIALDRVELSVAKGEYIAISGPSGCGKSTLLSLIGLLDRPTSGSYFLGGNDVLGLSAVQQARLRNRKIGFVFQNFNLIGDLNVYQNVALPLSYQGLKPAQCQPLVEEALERVGLADRRAHFPGQLSGGQQQRAAVARAWVTRPDLLLADEPTGNLDSKNGFEMMKLLNRLHEDGATVLLVTHDPRYLEFAVRKISLLDGSIVDDNRLG